MKRKKDTKDIVYTLIIIVITIGLFIYIQDIETELQAKKNYIRKLEHLLANKNQEPRYTEVVGITKTYLVKLDRQKLIDWVMTNAYKGRIYREIAEDIVDSCLRYKHLTLLLLGLIKKESGFYIYNQSPAGAIGLGQFIPQTITELIKMGIFQNKQDAYNPRRAIPAIVKWLELKGLDIESGKGLNKALYKYVGGSKKNPKADKVARKYIRDIKENIEELVVKLVEK